MNRINIAGKTCLIIDLLRQLLKTTALQPRTVTLTIASRNLSLCSQIVQKCCSVLHCIWTFFVDSLVVDNGSQCDCRNCDCGLLIRKRSRRYNVIKTMQKNSSKLLSLGRGYTYREIFSFWGIQPKHTVIA